MIRAMLAAVMLVSGSAAMAADVVNVVPRPEKIESIGADVNTKDLREETATKDDALGDAGYVIDASGGSVVVRAAAPAGFFYARQTLKQIVRDDGTMPGVRITDRPRFAYRGFLLDSARHMQSMEYLKRLIDLLASYKINRLHWHLTDDVGWRIEISMYPKLMEIGAWRGEGKDRYGGFYTKAQLRELAKYAQDRFITIIPEIEMPGHAQAMVAAYPQLGCTGETVPVLAKMVGSDHPLCPSNTQTYEFVRGVLDEVMEIFPSEAIHVGGDECPREPWKKCSRCQDFMRERGLASEDALQDEFTRRVGEYLESKGRRMQGWAEIMHAGAKLPKDAIVQQWREASVGTAAARAGHDVVVSQYEYLYFDYPPEKTPMRKTYEYEPVPAELEGEDAPHIIGVQAQLWTENLPSEADCDRNTWPRMLAMAELGWTAKDRRDWHDFVARLEDGQYARLAKALGTDPQKLAERGKIGGS